MTRMFTLCLSLFSLGSFGQDPETTISSEITHVTVFLEGAQVTRQAKVGLQAGVTILKFGSLAPGVLENSIQAEGPSGIKILSVSFRVNHLDELRKPETLLSMESERKALKQALENERAMERVYKDEEEILKMNKSIGGTQAGVEIAELRIAMDYFRQRLTDIQQRQLLASQNIARYNEGLLKLDAQLKELNDRKPQPSGEIMVKVSAKSPSTASLKLMYLVKEARWLPSYDIRAKDILSPVRITYKANVSQRSGEDWQNVELTISSGNPSQHGAKPTILPWIVGLNNRVADLQVGQVAGVQAGPYGSRAPQWATGRVVDEDGAGIPGVNVLMKGTTMGTVTDSDGYYSLADMRAGSTLVFSFIGFGTREVAVNGFAERHVKLQQDVQQLSEVVVTAWGYDGFGGGSSYYPRVRKSLVATPVIRQTNVEYTLDEPFSIKSDGEVRATDMVEYELDAQYEYHCVPKLEQDAFLVARILKWDEHNFLDGEANLFFEGKYVGKSVLDTRNTSDTLTLSLGRDGNVLVTREKKKDFSSRQMVGSNQKALLAFEISIRNKKLQPLTMVIEDQVPIPNDKEISVDRIEDSEGEYDKDTGILRWRKQVEPGKTETINLSYAVRYPKYSHMILE